MALSQIFLLLVSIVALSYAVGSEVGVVHGEAPQTGRTYSFAGDPYEYRWNGDNWEVIGGGGNVRDYSDWTPVNPRGEQVLNQRLDYNPSPAPEAPPTTPTPTDNPTGLPERDLSAELEDDFRDPTGEGGELDGIGGSETPTELSQDYLNSLSGAENICVGTTCGTFAATEGGGTITTAEGTTASFTSEQLAQQGITQDFTWGNFGSHLLSGFKWALGIYAGTQFVFGKLLDQDQALVDALSEAGAAGVLASSVSSGISEAWSLQEGWFGLEYGTWVGIGVGATYFITQYEEETTRVVEFSCQPWQAPTGGENCEECNNKGVPCSEYQCRALGQGCELINKGTGEESCVWVNRNDVNPPVMNPWENALLNEDYEYTPDNTISPPDRGVLIDYTAGEERIQVGDNSMGCIPAFTPLRFGITTDEPAKCKIDKFNKEGYEEMDLFLSDGLLRYNHSFGLTLPGASNLEGEGIELQNDGQFEAYVRCEDTNENSNVANFLFKYCVETGPDTTPPLIVATSIPNNAPISFNRTSLDFEVYVNEPAECRWDKVDRDYENMEPNMNCDTSVNQANAQGLYTCATTLDGLKSRTENEFYFRCRDQPEAEETSRNTNIESFEYNLQGTQPLVIDSVSPDDETVKDSTDSVKVTFEVETSAGHNQGEATCYWSDTGNEGDYVEFFNTRSHTHNHDFFLPEAEYIYHIRCTDLGGNTDNREITFEVESDNEAPKVVRAYHEETFLRVNTNEEARCVYDVVDCSYSFDDGIEMTSNDDLGHFVDWDVKSNLYIKCRDEFGNEPNPDQCSIVARTTNF